jgi:hypothetical protein
MIMNSLEHFKGAQSFVDNETCGLILNVGLSSASKSCLNGRASFRIEGEKGTEHA